MLLGTVAVRLVLASVAVRVLAIAVACRALSTMVCVLVLLITLHCLDDISSSAWRRFAAITALRVLAITVAVRLFAATWLGSRSIGSCDPNPENKSSRVDIMNSLG